MHYYWAHCPKCDHVWVQACIHEYGYVVPDSEDCPECKSAYELDTDSEYDPRQLKEYEREVPFDF